MNVLSRIVIDLDSMGARGTKRFFFISAACEADRGASENGIFIYFFRDNPKMACQRCCQNIHLKESWKTEEDTLVALFLSRRAREEG